MEGTVEVNEVMACKKWAFELSMNVSKCHLSHGNSTGPTLANGIVNHSRSGMI